jgi:hypothetical protein
MSWSFGASGRAEKVREIAAKNLEGSANACASVPVEAEAVRAFAKTVDEVCAAAEGQCVRISGNGHGWLEGGKLKGFNFVANIEVINMEG